MTGSLDADPTGISFANYHVNITPWGACFHCRGHGHQLKDCPRNTTTKGKARGAPDNENPEEKPKRINLSTQEPVNVPSASNYSDNTAPDFNPESIASSTSSAGSQAPLPPTPLPLLNK